MRTVFFVWQSDRPGRIGRDLIQRALMVAIGDVSRELRSDFALDHDTLGVPGSPDIIETVLRKIQQSMALVADLTFVAHTERDGSKKGVPNPNVMMEFGVAMEAIGWERIITVFNEAFGPIRELPFDVVGRRLSLIYRLPLDATDQQCEEVERNLVEGFRARIREVALLAGQTAAQDDFASPYEVSSVSFLSASRIGQVVGYESEQTDVFWKNAPLAFLRLIPQSPLQIGSRVQLKEAATGGAPPLEPLGRTKGRWESQNEWGFAVMSNLHRDGGFVHAWNFSQLFRTGELWGLDKGLFRARKEAGNRQFIPALAMEEIFERGLRNFLAIAEHRLAIKPPVRVVGGLGFIDGLPLAHDDSFSDPCSDPVVSCDGTLEAFDTSAHDVLKGFYRKVWDACGIRYSR